MKHAGYDFYLSHGVILVTVLVELFDITIQCSRSMACWSPASACSAVRLCARLARHVERENQGERRRLPGQVRAKGPPPLVGDQQVLGMGPGPAWLCRSCTLTLNFPHKNMQKSSKIPKSWIWIWEIMGKVKVFCVSTRLYHHHLYPYLYNLCIYHQPSSSYST